MADREVGHALSPGGSGAGNDDARGHPAGHERRDQLDPSRRHPGLSAPELAPFAEVERVELFGAEALLAYTNRVERLRATEPSTLIQLVSAWRATLKGP
jgi:hypothetical protein